MQRVATRGDATTQERATLRDWMAVAAGTLGAMMAVLDISIVNSSLPTIQGEIGASGSEGTWISTSFLAAEIVIIPLSAWLTRLLGLRIFLLWAVTLFMVFSVVCGLSTSLTMMIIGRAGQGLAGGALIPTAFTIIATRLPPSQQAIGTAAFGGTAILGPVFGPILGGWLTDSWSWHYAFFINIPIGVILVTLIAGALTKDHIKREFLGEIDWFGVIGLIVGLGSMTVVLEEGHRQRWFESSMIVSFASLAVIGFIAIGVGQRYAPKPVLKLSLLMDRNFGSVFLISVVFGAILYGVIYLIPQFLAQISGYNSLQAGHVVFLSGIPALLVMPFVPILFRFVDVRVAIATGLLVLGASCFINMYLTINSVGDAFTGGQLLRGGGQAAMMLFLNQAAISSVSESDAPDASSLFNTARNLGGSIGLAILATFQEHRLTIHQARISESVAANDLLSQQWLNDAVVRFDLGTGEGYDRAIRSLAGQIARQSAVMAYNDVFLIMGIAAFTVIPLALILRPITQRANRALH